MDIHILTRDQEPVNFTQTIPAPLARYKVPHARPTYSAGDFGALLLHEQAVPGFTILHKSYFIRQATSMYEESDNAAFYICFPINRPLRFQLQGLPKQRIAEGQFNIFYANPVHNQYWFEKGKYLIGELHCTPAMLDALKGYFPLVGDFLRKARLGFSCQLGLAAGHITPQMLQLWCQLRDCPYTGYTREVYLESIASQLLLLAVTRLSLIRTPANEVKLQPYEVTRLREAWEHMLQHLDQPGTVMELSQVVGLNDFKLKRGFKQLYGITLFEFLLEARMEKAKRLLRETDMTVHAVAISVGYKNISSFTVAFKKKYGVLPSEAQKRGPDTWPG